MTENPEKKSAPIPEKRVERLARFGGLTARVAGDAALRGAGALARGERPAISDLLLTPANAKRVVDQLSEMRGAAMKLGQLLAMDAGDLVPPEFAEVFARLRAQGHAMPPQQLKRTLSDNWGPDWLNRFKVFDPRPIAAASIGQVHRAKTRDGRDLAIKVQFPGVKNSIDSDVDNIATLLRLSGLTPADVDFTPLLEDAKRQLHDEADYERERDNLETFHGLLAGDPDYFVPKAHADLTTPNVIAMDYAPGKSVEAFLDADQDTRNHIATLLVNLVFRELFSLGVVQSDPNFANYRYDPTTGKVILLDFGATVRPSEGLRAGYAQMAKASTDGDINAATEIATKLGLLTDELIQTYGDEIERMTAITAEPFQYDGAYDFSKAALAARLRDEGLKFRPKDVMGAAPPSETVFVNRKFGGVFMLAMRMNAQVNVREIALRWTQ